MHLDKASLIAELQRAHAAHTVILYGSHARGDATRESDIDVAAFADVNRPLRDARLWNGTYLDGFVYPTALAREAPQPDLLKLTGGLVLLDERQLAAPLLALVCELEHRGPQETEDNLQMRRVWARKTLARIRRGDAEAWYRRHQLLCQLLEDWFALRGEWYRGPKPALAHLERHAPGTHERFLRALSPDAALDAIAALVDDVVGG